MTAEESQNEPAGAEADQEDGSLLRRYVEQNDKDALEALLRRHSNLAYRTAFRVMRDAGEAEDAVQMAFVRIMRDAEKCRGGEGVKLWIMCIVANTCKNMIKQAIRRRNREERTAEEPEDLAGGTDVVHELTDLVKIALDRLPEQYRMPIWLHHYEGLSFGEVAGVLAIPENTARSYANRGIAELRKKLARTVEAVPAASLVLALTSIPGEAAPATLVNSIGDLIAGVGRFSEAALAARGPATAKAAATGMGLKVAVAVGLAAACATVAGVAWLLPSTERTKPEDAAVFRQWKFDSAEAPAGLTVTVGGWRHVPGGGPDGSGCMQITSSVFRAELDLPRGRMPLLVTYRHRGILTPEFLQMGTTVFVTWEPWRRLALFHGLRQRGETYPIRVTAGGRPAGPWGSASEYVAEGWIAQRVGRGLQNLMLVERSSESRLTINARGAHDIDELTVRSIRPEELPDIRAFVDAVEKIPPDKRVGVVPLPQLKPGDPKGRVTVEFLSGAELP